MKFFVIIPLSNFQPENSAYPCDAPSIPVPFHQLYYLYSMPRIQLPRNACPNISFPIPGILSEVLWTFFLLSASLSYLYSVMEDIQCAYVRGLCLLHLSGSSHSHYYRSEQANRDIGTEHPLLAHDTDTWSPILCERLANLQYENSFAFLPYRKVRAFIETKVAAMKLRGFNPNLKQ